MTVFICIDERGGRLFYGKRQSRDPKVIEDVIRCADDGVLYISDFSEKLFADSTASVICVPAPLEVAGADAYVFCEEAPLGEYVDKIDKLIIYNWNEHYPSDFKLDIDPLKCGFKLRSKREFKGVAHKLISREDYVK